MAQAKKPITKKAVKPKTAVAVPQAPAKSLPKLSLKKVLLLGGALLAVTAVSLLVWQYAKTRAELRKYNDPKHAIQQESEDVVGVVSKVMVLPAGETPTVANISDVSKLRDKPFFMNAQNGDKVLVYQEAKKAIIYRPGSQQIVEVATYTSDAPLNQ